MKKNIWPVAILIAFVASVVTFIVLLNMEKNVLSEFEKEYVWALCADMPKGTECTEENLTIYVEQIQVDKKSIPGQRIENPEELWEMRSLIDLPQGTILTKGMFTGERSYVEGMQQPVLAGCKAEDLYQLVSGSLRKGDLINLYTVNEETEQTFLLWENVLVYEVFDSAGKSIAVTDEETAAARINILLEGWNAEQFYTELYRGSLRVVKVCGENRIL